MQSKVQKRNDARKKAEAQKAKKKAMRASKAGVGMTSPKPGKGKSLVPQSKKKK